MLYSFDTEKTSPMYLSQYMIAERMGGSKVPTSIRLLLVQDLWAYATELL